MLAFLAFCQIASSAVDTTLPRPIAQLVHTTWTAKEGAPTETRALAQTTDGYLWLGTVSGLVRFDGARFVAFEPRGCDRLPAGAIRGLLGTRDGSLWITWSSGGVSRLRDERVTSFGEQDGLPVTYRLTESRTGILVAGTAKGLAQFSGGNWKDVTRQWGYPGTESKGVWFDRTG